MTNDIVLNNSILNDDGMPYGFENLDKWTPIGQYGIVDCDFMGTFDGCGHTIYGLYIESTNDLGYQGLFGTIKNAVVKNIKLVDCMIDFKPTYLTNKIAIGMLCGLSCNSRCSNIHVSKAYIGIKDGGCSYSPYVGGLIGRAYGGSAGALDLSRSSFDGIIDYTFKNYNLIPSIGGLVGVLAKEGSVYDCTSRGRMLLGVSAREKALCSGIVGYQEGTSSTPTSFSIANCANYMNFDVASVGSVCMLDIAGIRGNSLKGCANFGIVRIGSGTDLSLAVLTGLQGKKIEDCANYLTIDIDSGCEFGNSERVLATLVDGGQVTRCIDIQEFNNIQGNGKAKVRPFKVETATDCHLFYYDSNGDNFTSDGIPSGVTRHENIMDFKKEEPFFSNGAWGIVGEDDNLYHGYPMPMACGGVATSYSGKGTAKNPYLISSETDLKEFMNNVNNGNNLKDKYFRLDADIYGGNISTIGNSSQNPFMGHFDGNGHTITGLRRCLFGYMYGTVKNLTLLDANISCQSVSAALALYVGGTDGSFKGEISNCYVSGIVNVDRRWDDGINTIGGLCNWVSEGSKVHDCYFKGTLMLSTRSIGGGYIAAGIAASNWSSVGIFNCYASFDVRQSGSFIGNDVSGISSGGINNCYAIVSGAKDIIGCTLLNAEAELSASALGDQWIQGLYRPVLKGTKYYEVKTPEGETTYLDGIPAEAAVEGGAAANAKLRTKSNGEEVDADALKSNYITCYVPESEEELRDETLWSLPNVAIYSAEYNMDVIPNFYLDNREDLRYTPTEGAKKAMGAMYYPLQQNATGWHMLCLPGYVTKDLFPEGSRLLVVDGVDYDAKTVQVSEADTISAATPFIAYIPVEAEDVNLVSFGDLVFTPRIPTTTSPLVGTFINNTLDDCGTELSSDGKTLLHSLIADIKPFHAWIGGVVEDMEIVSTSTGIKLVGKDNDGNERIYDLRGVEMKSEKGIYIKGGKVRVKAPSGSPRGE